MESIEFLLAAAVIVIALVTGSIVRNRKADRRIREKVEGQWAVPPEKEYREGDMQAIASYFKNILDANTDADKKRVFLDDITWDDIDMDRIYTRLNSTFSSIGEEYLYAMLREPLVDSAELKERNRLAEFFQRNEKQRKRLQYHLAKMGICRYPEISDYFLNNQEYKPFQRIKYLLLLGIFLLSPFVMLINFPIGALMLVGSFFTNMAVYYRAKSELSGQLERMSYIVSLINCSKRIASEGIPELAEYKNRLNKALSKLKGTGFNSFYSVFYNTQNELVEYFKIIFLVELITFESMQKRILRNKTDLRILYETIGLLDSMMAVASFRESVPAYTVPDLFRADHVHPAAMTVRDAYHPLIEDAVTNSLDVKKSVLITGSNASGKSTFLKTMVINAIFAQTIGTCLASEYRSCFFQIYTSMALKDNLLNGESYYIAEIKSLKRILDSLNSEHPLLCVIDEVLRGTNTIERIAASSEVMRYLSGKNCICLTATHDIELVAILASLFDNYHFQESFENNNILFDYRIIPGKSNTRNAIKLLEIMGYPEETVRSARNKAERFEQEGTWAAGA